MKTANKMILFTLALGLAAALGACGERGKNGAAGGKSGGGVGMGAGGSAPCPAEADVARVVEAPVRSKPQAAGCYYETPDAETSVSILSVSPGRAGQLLEEMKAAAKPYGTEVMTVNVGERGYAWGAPGYAQGFTVAGGRAYMLDVTTVGGGGDKKAAVIQLLKLMIS